MKINALIDKHDRAALVALLLEDWRRVSVIIDDGIATVRESGSEPLFDTYLSSVIDGNSEALLYVPDTDKAIQYLDENYEKQMITVSPTVVYKFRIVDGKMVVKAYGGKDLRELLLEGI